MNHDNHREGSITAQKQTRIIDLRSLRQGQTGRPEAEKMFRAGISNPLLKVATRTVARQQTRSLTIPINQVSSCWKETT